MSYICNKYKVIKLFITFFIYFTTSFTIGFLPKHVNQKKLVSISPGGLTGFYTLGITSYLKENYNLSDYAFLGASAGSWNALLLTCKYSNHHIVHDLLSQDIFKNTTSISILQKGIKNYILNTYHDHDFDLHRLFISVSIFRYFYFKPKIIYNFVSLKDALDGCTSSSYIPMVTGGIRLTRIKNIIIDGGWPKFPPDDVSPYFTIEPSMWGKEFKRGDRFKYPDNYHFFREMYELGYNDTHNNKHLLDQYFSLNDINIPSSLPSAHCIPGHQYYDVVHNCSNNS